MKCYSCETGNCGDCRGPDCSCDDPRHEDPPCSHRRIMADHFAALVGVARFIPGTGYCLDCKEPIPYGFCAEGKP